MTEPYFENGFHLLSTAYYTYEQLNPWLVVHMISTKTPAYVANVKAPVFLKG